MSEYPVVVVGAGPVGLAAAAHLTENGTATIVLERGPTAGSAVAQWNHVRLFSPWAEVIDPAAARLLAASGWIAPDGAGYATGREWVENYLTPLAAVLGDSVRLRSEVIGVARRGRDRIVDAGRDTEPLSVHVRRSDGTEERILARAVIDASGTWGTPNPLGSEGLPAVGERSAAGEHTAARERSAAGEHTAAGERTAAERSAAGEHTAAGERTAAERISYRVPDLTGAAQHHYAGAHTVIVGSGHSALTAIIAFAELAARHPGTRLTWAVRRPVTDAVFGGGASDELAARGALGLRAKQAVDDGILQVVSGFRTEEVATDGERLTLVGDNGASIDHVDRVVALTGFRPDLSWLSEVRLDLDSTLQSPKALAPLIDPNVHSCGTVYPHGVVELTQPEPGFYLAGMKSYGRAPTFLAMTGYEQVRSIAAELAGDHEGARAVELTLPDTGVCGGAGLFDDPTADPAVTGGCCGTPEPIGIGLGSGTHG